MEKPILYYWAPCPTCSVLTHFADEHGIELDKRDVEQEAPYQDGQQLVNGNDECLAYLRERYL